jgi:glycosyltransferase involved in cell wall biosynthesis
VRIAMVHSFYGTAQPSGENRVVEDQVSALREAGHDVLLVRRNTDDLQGGLYGPRTGLKVASGGGFDPTSELHAFRPEVVHVQNLFPNISSRWIPAWPGPVVVTLHNYRATCSNGLFFRDGAICTECATHGAIRAVRHACYRDSRGATIPVAMSRARTRRELLTAANAVITTSELADEVIHRYVDANLQTDVIPNFGPVGRASTSTPAEPRSWIAMGRFSPEKGFVELMTDWPANERLVVVGEGSQRISLANAARGKSIEFLPAMEREELRKLIATSYGLVFPSRWFESDPQVVVEAMRLGLPVVAFHVNSVAQIVVQSGAGAIYNSPESLEAALAQVVSNRPVMSAAAISEFQRRWTKQAWLRSIEGLYRRVVAQDSGLNVESPSE